MNGDGLISKLFGWFAHPINSDETYVDWIAGLGVILVVAFLWAQVVNTID
jgi:hypothetical protein